MKVKIEIDCDNAAFEDSWQDEVSRILHRLADEVENGSADRSYPLMDMNGNKVGQMTIEHSSDGECRTTNDREYHVVGCVCADCAGAELTAEND